MTEDGEFQLVMSGEGLTGPTGRAGGTGTQPNTGANQRGGGTMVGVQQQNAQRNALTQSVAQAQPGGRAGGTPGVIGVVSKSDEKAMRLYNGRDKYNEWLFVATQASTAAGARGGVQRPNGPANVGRGRIGGFGQRGASGPP
jgi:hypothetical protein